MSSVAVYNHNASSAGLSQVKPNAFYDELAAALHDEPLTTAPMSEVAVPNVYTLRRAWIPIPGDALQTPAFTEVAKKYEPLAIPDTQRGMSLLSSSTIVGQLKRGAPPASKEELEEAGALLPPYARLAVGRVVIFGAPQADPYGKRYVGLGLISKSLRRVSREHRQAVDTIGSRALRLHSYTGHISLFITRKQAVAERLRDDLQAAFTFPTSLLLGAAKPYLLRWKGDEPPA
jgi:hypothetical protein